MSAEMWGYGAIVVALFTLWLVGTMVLDELAERRERGHHRRNDP